jgi:hypothetical protein
MEITDESYPSHVYVDGKLHKIARIDEHDDGPRHSHRVWLGCGLSIDVQEPHFDTQDRWKKHDYKVADCESCSSHEYGAPAVEHPTLVNPTKTVAADIETAISCPKCSGKVYLKRNEVFACSSHGHEFTPVELMNHISQGFQSLTEIMKRFGTK